MLRYVAYLARIAGSSSIAGLISAVKASNASTFTSGGLSALKASIQPCYAAPAGASEGMSTTLKVAIGAAGVWVAYRANVQARSHDWIVDLSLDVLQAAWWITFASFIPFRSVVLSLRGLSPHTATPLNALKPVLNFKRLDRNSCLNFQRIGESKQRPLELCQCEDLEALPQWCKEYQQGYKLVNDRLPKAEVQDMAVEAPCRLLDLDDALLLSVLSSLDPVPDGFNLARTCLRLKRLTHDSRNWLSVVGPAAPLSRPNHYRTLTCAVKASRPGDTIFCCPGAHVITDGLIIDKCLNLVGQAASRTQLGSSLYSSLRSGTQALLDVRATCKITGIAMQSHAGPCILHRAGQLHVEGCQLACQAPGLEHLCSPLITTAVSPAAQPMRRHPWGAGGASGSWALAGVDGTGRLSVVECQLLGGSRAVQCQGSGALRCVRVIHTAQQALFYLQVDSALPSIPPHTMPQGPAAEAAAPTGCTAPGLTPAGRQPSSWRGSWDTPASSPPHSTATAVHTPDPASPVLGAQLVRSGEGDSRAEQAGAAEAGVPGGARPALLLTAYPRAVGMAEEPLDALAGLLVDGPSRGLWRQHFLQAGRGGVHGCMTKVGRMECSSEGPEPKRLRSLTPSLQ
ncbi:hypothetical protein QJQ45_004328 [Haematococcus lacustris]|nr:hypothetical protein QJQ45_004328 [Haematococcus lacustris]